MACGRDSEHTPWPGRPGLRGNQLEAGALGLLRTRMELPPWPGTLGSSGRPWLLPNWTVYTFHDWPPDLAFAIGRPVCQLRSPQHLAFPATKQSKHVLLLDSSRSLARRCPCLVQGGHVSRPIRWTAGPGTHRGRSDNTDWHLVVHSSRPCVPVDSGAIILVVSFAWICLFIVVDWT